TTRVTSMPPETVEAVRDSLASALHTAFLGGLPLMALGLGAALMLKELPLRTTSYVEEPEGGEAGHRDRRRTLQWAKTHCWHRRPAARRRPRGSQHDPTKQGEPPVKRFLVAMLVALTALLLASPPVLAQKVFKIGAIVPVSGPAAAFGLGVQRGLELAAED